MTFPVWEHTLTDWELGSGVGTPTWTGDCATWAYGDIFYEQFNVTPASGSTWAAGFRPASITISGTGLGDWLVGGTGYVNSVSLDLSAVVSGTDTYTFDIVGLTEDITHVGFDGGNGLPLEICDISFSGTAACTQFWTNHVAQREVE